MRRYTSPTETLTVKGVDLTGMYNVFVTFRQDDTVLTITEPTVSKSGDDTVVSCALTQEQTALFKVSNRPCEVQVNWNDEQGVRGATEIKEIEIKANLYEDVMYD